MATYDHMSKPPGCRGALRDRRPSYSYATGPDGKLYAVGGDVTLDDSPDPRGPEETIQKEQTIIAAANAPADPSMQDRMVAAQAARSKPRRSGSSQPLPARQRGVQCAKRRPSDGSNTLSDRLEAGHSLKRKSPTLSAGATMSKDSSPLARSAGESATTFRRASISSG